MYNDIISSNLDYSAKQKVKVEKMEQEYLNILLNIQILILELHGQRAQMIKVGQFDCTTV